VSTCSAVYNEDDILKLIPWLVLRILRARISHQLLINNHKMEVTKFEIRVLLKHYWKQDYKAAAAARKICEVEGEGVKTGKDSPQNMN
ncbi:hypothetical protein C0J52_26488, partial [Blattella germanica]